MAQQPLAVRLHELPTIPPSMDPISTCSTIPRPLSSVEDGTGMRRSISMNIDDRHSNGEDEAAEFDDDGDDGERGRQASPIRANVRRRRSAASAPGNYLDNRPLSSLSVRSMARGRQDSAVNSSGPSIPSFSRQRSTTSAQQAGTSSRRTPSRGRPRRRLASFPDVEGSRKKRRANEKSRDTRESINERNSSIKHSFRVTKRPSSLAPAQLPLSGDENSGGSDKQTAYEIQGAFRLQKNKGTEGFSFPKPLAYSEPIWRAGDGFSGDEARPGFMFLMTGTHKRRRSRSPPGMGRLDLEKESESRSNLGGSVMVRPKIERFTQTQMKHRRGEIKDIWPTVDNFSDASIVRARNPTVPASQEIIPSTIPPQPTPIPRARDAPDPSVSSRKGGRLNFEDFGRRLRRIMSSSQGDNVPGHPPTDLRGAGLTDDSEVEDEAAKGVECSIEEDELVAATYYSHDDDGEEDQDDEEGCDGCSDSMPNTSLGRESSISSDGSPSRDSAASAVCNHDSLEGQGCAPMQPDGEMTQKAPVLTQVESTELSSGQSPIQD
ncbi:hypothetical protein F4779DRAFT_617058 [Xylariaceae sp. FL0662B]|nr:hypothetical protein F4779DRAFT_617058 [Xylariaceae sp. FL0662B]